MSRWTDREAVSQQIGDVLASSEAGTLDDENRKARAIRAENIQRTMLATGHSEAMVVAHNITS